MIISSGMSREEAIEKLLTYLSLSGMGFIVVSSLAHLTFVRLENTKPRKWLSNSRLKCG
jgi:hypothetical protein